MSASSYPEAIRRLLASEGGYVNHPSDPGGPTNFGITLADYRKYVKPDASAADIRVMRVEEAKAIYRSKYWAAMRADELPAGVDYCICDYAVNSGTGRAPKVLQRVLGTAVSGRVDDATLAAARSHETGALIEAICAERLRFLQGLKTWNVFGKGWARRVSEVRAASLAIAHRGVGAATVPADTPATRAPGKGAVPANDKARKGSAGGAVASGGLVAQQAAESGANWIVIVMILGVTAAITIVAWSFWRWRQRHRQEAAA
jgi:lysozyme family protein